MGSKAYTTAQKAEAIALCGLVGAEMAGQQLGIDPRTVSKWSSVARVRSPDYVEPDVWQKIHDAATARVATMIGSGKLSPQSLATVAAIAKRNLTAAAAKPKVEPPTPAGVWADAIEDAFPGERPFLVSVAVLAYLKSCDQDAPAPSAEQVVAHVKSLGDLSVWRERHVAEAHDATQRQLAANREAREALEREAEEAARVARRGHLDAESQSLLAEVDAILAGEAPSTTSRWPLITVDEP